MNLMTGGPAAASNICGGQLWTDLTLPAPTVEIKKRKWRVFACVKQYSKRLRVENENFGDDFTIDLDPLQREVFESVPPAFSECRTQRRTVNVVRLASPSDESLVRASLATQGLRRLIEWAVTDLEAQLRHTVADAESNNG